MKNHILVLSKNKVLLDSLLLDIKAQGYSASSGNYTTIEADMVIRQGTVAILHDLTAWDSDSLQSYQKLKNNPKLQNQKVLAIILTSEDNLPKITSIVEFDDIILMPYNPHELGLRIKHLLWQKDIVCNEDIIKIDDIAIRLASYEVRVKGKQVDLAFKEYELLKYLVTHRGRAFTRESLLNAIWGDKYSGGTRTVDVHIRRIRTKINDTKEEYIKTVRGVGYKFKE